MPHETVGDIGEFVLLARLRARLGSPFLGDDTAVLPATSGTRLLATVDAQVDGIHFLRDLMTPQQIGRRAIAVNVSDIAAMGGVPRYALLSLLLQPSIEVGWIEALYDGVREEAARWEMRVAGGNISRTPGPLVVDVAVLGEAQEDQILRRSGARPGDALMVTGDLGRASAGLLLLQKRMPHPLVAAYCTPTPRVREGQALAQTQRVHAAMDLSDGLGSDVYRICEESRVGAAIDAAALPISSDVRSAAAALGVDPLGLALYGGEDFELLIAVPTDAVEILAAVSRGVGTALTVIGAVREKSDGVTLRLPDGSARLLAGGWDHFARREPTQRG
jgi:thiamine-monophosphate kinase